MACDAAHLSHHSCVIPRDQTEVEAWRRREAGTLERRNDDCRHRWHRARETENQPRPFPPRLPSPCIAHPDKNPGYLGFNKNSAIAKKMRHAFVRNYWLCNIAMIQLGSWVAYRDTNKAPSTPATTSKQHCRMLQVERFFRQS